MSSASEGHDKTSLRNDVQELKDIMKRWRARSLHMRILDDGQYVLSVDQKEKTDAEWEAFIETVESAWDEALSQRAIQRRDKT
jgi:hypothetical protein